MTRRIFLGGALAALLISGLPAIASAQLSGNDMRDLARISNYLNGVKTLEGDFVQVGHDGELSEGQFYLRRPGRIRFEYKPPNPALVIADGTWVGVYDTRLNTLDRIPLKSTPLSILLQKKVNLGKDKAIRSIDRSPGLMRVVAVNPSDPGQGSITMVFVENPLELRQWIVVDPQGLTTTVALGDTRANIEIDNNLFFIEDPQ